MHQAWGIKKWRVERAIAADIAFLDGSQQKEGATSVCRGRVMSREIDRLDRPPAGWFVAAVMKAGRGRTWDWVALMIDIDPTAPDFPESLYGRTDKVGHNAGSAQAVPRRQVLGD